MQITYSDLALYQLRMYRITHTDVEVVLATNHDPICQTDDGDPIYVGESNHRRIRVVVVRGTNPPHVRMTREES